MSDFNEKHYWIDPGMGKKMPGCPYSTYEDGHDVQEYIVPPKGYVFAGFRFDPNASNQIYDGKLTAEFTKEPFTQRIKADLWKFVLVFAIIVVVTLVTILAAGVFRSPKPKRAEKEPKTTVQPTDTAKSEDKASTTTFNETPAPVVAKPSEPKPTETELVPAQVETITSPTTQPTPLPAADDPNTQFKQEFWALIHTRNASMDAYTDLYNNYKTKVSGEEFDYLRFIILKDYVSFKAWYDKLKTVPESQLQSVENIDALRNKIN